MIKWIKSQGINKWYMRNQKESVNDRNKEIRGLSQERSSYSYLQYSPINEEHTTRHSVPSRVDGGGPERVVW